MESNPQPFTWPVSGLTNDLRNPAVEVILSKAGVISHAYLLNFCLKFS